MNKNARNVWTAVALAATVVMTAAVIAGSGVKVQLPIVAIEISPSAEKAADEGEQPP